MEYAPGKNDEYALIALRDFRKKFLHHQALCAAPVQRLGDAAEVQAIRPHAKDTHAAHAIERLEDDVAQFVDERIKIVGGAAHQGWCGDLA